MSFIANNIACQTSSQNKRFGLCDDPLPSKNPAYIDEENGEKWIAVVVNDSRFVVLFTAIDNCIPLLNEDGTMSKRCDGVLTFENTLIFVELKERKPIGNNWVKDAEKQLRSSIIHFEEEEETINYEVKKAYVANSEHPRFKRSQAVRMNKFQDETGYVLRIENRIII